MTGPKTVNLKANRDSQFAAIAFLAVFAGVALCANSVFALGIALPDQDAFATARGNAFVATADDPAAVFYNPAGISQLDGMQTSIGAYGIAYSDTFQGATHADSKTEYEVLPQIFSTLSLPKYHLTFGFGTYSPYGLRMEWPVNTQFVPIGETGEIDYFTANPVVAYQVLPSLTLAAGITLNYSEADLKEFPGFVNHFRGRDFDVGYNLGVLWHPLEQHSFGVTYKSATDMNYEGHATIPAPPFTENTKAEANFHFPQTISAGYSFRPTTNWNFEADADWSDWTGLRTVTVNPLPENLGFNWHPSWMFDFGATRYFGNGWRLSGGYIYSLNSVPTSYFNPLVPDSDRHIFSVGVGKKYTKFSWDVAYQFAWGPSRSVSGDTLGVPPFPSSPANGSYEFFSHAITINFGYRF